MGQTYELGPLWSGMKRSAAQAAPRRAGGRLWRPMKRWRREGGACHRFGSSGAPQIAQPAAYGVTRSPHRGHRFGSWKITALKLGTERQDDLSH